MPLSFLTIPTKFRFGVDGQDGKKTSRRPPSNRIGFPFYAAGSSISSSVSRTVAFARRKPHLCCRRKAALLSQEVALHTRRSPAAPAHFSAALTSAVPTPRRRNFWWTKTASSAEPRLSQTRNSAPRSPRKARTPPGSFCGRELPRSTPAVLPPCEAEAPAQRPAGRTGHTSRSEDPAAVVLPPEFEYCHPYAVLEEERQPGQRKHATSAGLAGQRFGLTLAAKDWATIFPFRTQNVSVANSYELSAVSAVQRM
jgi:hypothetical protein